MKFGDIEFSVNANAGRQNANKTVTVHQTSGGDYTSINDALEFLSRTPPEYVAGGYTAEISLLTGFVMSEQVLVAGLDLSWISITSVDAEVTITRSALTTSFVGQFPAFGCQSGKLPIIDVLFNMNATGTATGRDGIFLYRDATVIVTNGNGVKNAGGTGLHVIESSHAHARQGVFSGAGSHGAFAFLNSDININGGDVSGATTYGVYAANGSRIAAGSVNAGSTSTGYRVETGSMITAASSSGGTLSQTANTLTASGIIFQ